MVKAHRKFQRIKLCLLLTTLLLGACATTKEVGNQQNLATKIDPYEPINRKIYDFNDSVDSYVAKPIADAYTFITPKLMQTGVANFFNNLKNVNVIFNDLLQAKFSQGVHDAGRLALNSTLGLGGLIDVADDVGLKQSDEDFEQTLAVWGVPQGSYLVIPFLGPTTTRGIPGAIVDTAANPSSYVGAPIQLVSLLNTRANAEGSIKFINEAALDKYVFTRDSFLQWRDSLATDGKTNTALNFEDEFDDTVSNKSQASENKTASKHTLTLIADDAKQGNSSNTPASLNKP